jgi:hypothetical protein
MALIRSLGARRKRLALIAAGFSAVLLTGFMTASLGAASNANAAAHGGAAVAHTGHLGPGRLARIALSSKPFVPTAAQKAARTRDMAFLAKLPKPPIGPHTTARSVQKLAGQPTTLTTTRLPTDFRIWKDSTIPAACSNPLCGQSTINEPDTAASGRFVEQTSNWDMAYSTNFSSATPTWQYQDPYGLNSNFCCDQTITYVPSRNKFIYEGLTLGTGSQTGFTIAVATAYAPAKWCTYHFDGSNVGGTAGDVLDYPKIAYANNNVYATWNRYDPTGSTWLSTGLARLPIDSLSACSSVSYSYIDQTNNFTFGLTYGDSSLDTFYWVSDWYTQGSGSGSSERIYWWPENSATYSWADISVAAYNFNGGSCASQDGVVTDWCGRLDPRWETAWISRGEYNAQANSAFAGDTILGVAITAGPGGGDPFPYVIYEYFKLNALSYIQTSQTYNDGFAIAFAGCSPNIFGSVGCVMSWGGGTGTTHYYPGGMVLVQDDASPTQPWAYSFNVSGIGNASDWGDYMISQPFQPSVGPFIASEWAVDSSGNVVPHVVVWDRNRDTSGFDRWVTH